MEFFMVIGVFFLAALIVGHEFGHFAAAKLFKMRVDEFGIGFPPRIASKKFGETRYSINALPFGGFVRIHGEHPENGEGSNDDGRSFIAQPVWRRAVVVVSGVLMNFIIGWFAFSAVLFTGTPVRLFVSNVASGSPAAEAGFKQGEYIEGFTAYSEFTGFIEENKGRQIEIGGKMVTPRVNPPEGEGALGLGITEVGFLKRGLMRAIGDGFMMAVLMFAAVFQGITLFFAGLLTGNMSVLGDVSGPIGVLATLGESGKIGFQYFVHLLGLISINLAVINLIPFPALDGGRMLFLAIEKITKRRVGLKVETVANAVGIILLLSIMVIVTIRDIMIVF